MENSFQSEVTPLASPWRTFLLKELSIVQERLWIICPYVKTEVISALREALRASPAASKQHLEVRLLTRIEPEELLSGSSDITALLQFLHWPQDIPGCKVILHAINNIHAKVWLMDSRVAIVGSGNATPSGLDENLEYGLAVTDPALVAHIINDWELWWQQSAPITLEQVEQLQSWLERAMIAFQEVEARFVTERQQIEHLLSPVPHLATHHFPQDKETREKPSYIAEESSIYTTAPPIATITCSAFDFWQALDWIAPQIDELQHMYEISNSFVRLSWQSMPEPLLQYTWADGRRISQARIPSKGDESQLSWAMTLNLEQVKILSDSLLAYLNISSAESTITCQLFRQGSTYELAIARGSEAILKSVKGILSSPPPPFPMLRPPVSHFTVEHRHLLDMLTIFGQYDSSFTMFKIQMLASGEIIQIHSAIEAGTPPAHILLPTIETILVGPPITLRLHYSTFRSILQEAPISIVTWQFTIDRNAEVVQLIPQTENQIIRTWRHQMKHEE